MPDRPIILPVLKTSIEPAVAISNKLSIDEKRALNMERRALNIKSRQERRKRKKDRRKDIRDGVIVSLSSDNDRRKKNDRRNVKTAFMLRQIGR